MIARLLIARLLIAMMLALGAPMTAPATAHAAPAIPGGEARAAGHGAHHGGADAPQQPADQHCLGCIAPATLTPPVVARAAPIDPMPPRADAPHGLCLPQPPPATPPPRAPEPKGRAEH